MRNWPAIATARCQGLDSIVIFCHWFGPWPEWFPLTLATMAANPSVQWVFVTDNAPPPCRPHNVSFECISLAEYLEKARDILATPIVTPNPHQISRLKIFTGKLQENIVQDFDWFGYCDLDVVFGDIRRIYTPALMDRHSMLTTHRDLVAGHFTLFRNTALLRNVYRLIPHWEHFAAIEDEPVNLEEWHLAPVFGVLPRQPRWRSWLWRRFNRYIAGALFREEYSTPLIPIKWHDGRKDHPQNWFWINGRLTNDRHPERDYLYLHFMNWKSSRWLGVAGLQPPSAWEKLDKLVHVSSGTEHGGFIISPRGFHPLNERPKSKLGRH